MRQKERKSIRFNLILMIVVILIFFLCICAGSVMIPLGETLTILKHALLGGEALEGAATDILMTVRIPRVICVGLVGAALALTGAVMQGLLRNPLAYGSTLGVSSGASLGAVLSIAFGITIPGASDLGTMGMAILFAFLSMMIILSLAYKLDYSLSTNTIILIGVVYSMLMNSILNLIVTLASDKVKEITFWTMGSLAGSTYRNAIVLLVALLIFGTIVLCRGRELNAFALGEENARNIGIDVQKVKLGLLVCVSALIGITVSIGGAIGFVGMLVPHITRFFTGPDHKKLLPASLLIGAGFLMIADLIARTLLNPRQLPVGVVTSFVGALSFIVIFYRSRKGK